MGKPAGTALFHAARLGTNPGLSPIRGPVSRETSENGFWVHLERQRKQRSSGLLRRCHLALPKTPSWLPRTMSKLSYVPCGPPNPGLPDLLSFRPTSASSSSEQNAAQTFSMRSNLISLLGKSLDSLLVVKLLFYLQNPPLRTPLSQRNFFTPYSM